VPGGGSLRGTLSIHRTSYESGGSLLLFRRISSRCSRRASVGGPLSYTHVGAGRVIFKAVVALNRQLPGIDVQDDVSKAAALVLISERYTSCIAPPGVARKMPYRRCTAPPSPFLRTRQTSWLGFRRLKRCPNHSTQIIEDQKS